MSGRRSGSRSPPRRSSGGRAPPPTRGADYDSDYSDDEEGCCKMVTRNTLWWANLALLICGLACLGGSIFLWVDDNLDWNDSDVAFRATIFSCFIIILGLIGMQGTCYEKVDKCDLAVYIFLLGSVIAAELAVVIWYFADGSDFENMLKDIWDDWSQGKQTSWMGVRDCGFERSNYVYNGVNIDTWAACQQPTGTYTGTCSNPPDVAAGQICTDVCFTDCYNEAKNSFKNFGTLTSVLTLLLCIFQITLFTIAIILCCGCCGSTEYADSSYDEPPRPRPRPPPRGSYGRRPGSGSGYGTQMARRGYGSGSRPSSGYGGRTSGSGYGSRPPARGGYT